VLCEEGINQFRLILRQPLHVYSMTRGPKAIFRDLNNPGRLLTNWRRPSVGQWIHKQRPPLVEY